MMLKSCSKDLDEVGQENRRIGVILPRLKKSESQDKEGWSTVVVRYYDRTAVVLHAAQCTSSR
jgi:hypothetical protein